MLLYQQLNMQFGIEARFAISSFRHRGFRKIRRKRKGESPKVDQAKDPSGHGENILRDCRIRGEL